MDASSPISSLYETISSHVWDLVLGFQISLEVWSRIKIGTILESLAVFPFLSLQPLLFCQFF